MKTKFPNELLFLEAKNAKKRTPIQLSHLGMVPMKLPGPVNQGAQGCSVIGSLLEAKFLCKMG